MLKTLKMNKFLYYMNNIALLFSSLFILHSVVAGEDQISAFLLLLILGLFQLIMSTVFVFNKKQSSNYLDLHFVISVLYILLLFGLQSEVIKNNALLFFGLIPLKIAFFFSYGVWRQIKKQEALEYQIRKNNKVTFVLDENQMNQGNPN